MDNPFTALLDNIATALAADMPHRGVVTRDVRDFAAWQDIHIQAGVISLHPTGGKPVGPLETMNIIIDGEIRVAEDSPPRAAEDAALQMVWEALEWVRGQACFDLTIVEWAAVQKAHPYGYMAIELTGTVPVD